MKRCALCILTAGFMLLRAVDAAAGFDPGNWTHIRAFLTDHQRSLAEIGRIATKATPDCPAPSPFPTAPPAGAQSTTFTVTSLGDSFSAVLWRQACGTDGVTYLFLRVTPTAGSPFLCSSAISIVQGSTAYDVKLVASVGGPSVCADQLVPITVLVTNWSFDPPFDQHAALDFIYDAFPDKVKASLPVFGTGPTPVTPAIGLWWNPAESGSGYNFDVKHGVLVVTIYSYKPNGDSEWYIASGALTNNGRSFTGSLDKARNGQCISCAYKAPTLGGSDGTIAIEFTSATTATMTLPGGRVIDVVPQAF